ncbi:MAG: hypothetical protein J7J92_01680 [Candidatus Aenigmarchaeota archaeon]|nr:hypothetical protein [Candidatus Aenigmarchaeota archaeon]
MLDDNMTGVKKIVKCPKCGWTQKCLAEKSVRCFRCGYSYLLRPKGKPSRIVKILK